MESSGKRFCLRMRDFESNLCETIGDLRAESAFFDVTLGCAESNGQQKLQAHKVILSASSEFFKTVLRQEDHPKPYIYLKGIGFHTLQSILDFIYQGEVSIAQEQLEAFLAVTAELKIKGLVNKDGSKIGNSASNNKSLSDVDPLTTKTGEEISGMFVAPKSPTDMFVAPKSPTDILAPITRRGMAKKIHVRSPFTNSVETLEPLAEESEFKVGSESTGKYMVCLDNKWTCSSCLIPFKSQAFCRRHVEKEHVQNEDPFQNVFKCFECSFDCKTNAELKTHMDAEHSFVAVPKKESKEINESELQEIAQEFGLIEETEVTNESTVKTPEKPRTTRKKKRNSESQDSEEDKEWSAKKSGTKERKRKVKKEDTNQKESTRKSLSTPLMEIVERFDDGKARCTECDKMFASYVGIRQHLDVVHNDQADIFQCSLCKENDKEVFCKSKQRFRIHLNYGHDVKGKNTLSQYGIPASKEEYDAAQAAKAALKAENAIPTVDTQEIEEVHEN